MSIAIISLFPTSFIFGISYYPKNKDYPFNELKVNRVTGMIPCTNKASIRFVEKLGAELETTLKDAHPKGDLLVYRMIKKDCKYLGV